MNVGIDSMGGLIRKTVCGNRSQIEIACLMECVGAPGVVQIVDYEQVDDMCWYIIMEDAGWAYARSNLQAPRQVLKECFEALASLQY